LIFSQLCHELVKEVFTKEKIYNIGRYWDDTHEIDLVAKTKSGKKIVGNCKYRDKKVSKRELTKLKESAKQAQVEPDIYVIFAKKGFSSELKSLKSDTLLLFTCKHLTVLKTQ